MDEKPLQNEDTLPDRVLLALKSPIAMMGLEHTLLTGLDGLEICGRVATPEGVRKMCQSHKPCLLILDASLDAGGEFCLVRELREFHPNLRVVVVDARADAASLKLALQSGVMAFLTNGDSLTSILDAVQSVRAGRLHMGSTSASKLLEAIARDAGDVVSKMHALLTPRELEVFRMRGELTSIKEIANGLHLSVKTVEGHLHKIRVKLHLDAGADLHKVAAEFVLHELGRR